MGCVCWSERGNMMLQWTQSQLSVWLNYPSAFLALLWCKSSPMHKFINQQYLDWKEGWQRSISKQLLLCICDIFFPYNIDHSTKNVCSGIFLLKHTYALFVKVESGKNSGSEKDKHARGKRWHQYWHLSWGWLTFVFWHIERCICWIIIGGGWWLSDHLAATVSSWWDPFIQPTYPPSHSAGYAFAMSGRNNYRPKSISCEDLDTQCVGSFLFTDALKSKRDRITIQEWS